MEQVVETKDVVRLQFSNTGQAHVTIPKSIVEELALVKSQPFLIQISGTSIVLAPVR